MITPTNVCRHELIGLPAAVHHSTNPAQRGLSGIIVGETRNMVVLRTDGGDRMIAKQGILLDVHLPDDTRVRVDGSVLVQRPERRISMRIRKPRYIWRKTQD